MHIKVFLKNQYEKVREIMPVSMRSMLSKIIFLIPQKPFYFLDNNIHNRTEFNKGLLCISADFELAWGWRYAKNQKLDAEELGMRERRNISLIIRALDELKIPITWATVGHLFLSECKRNNGFAHPEMPRPHHFENKLWNFESGDWYDYDPRSNLSSAPAWYAPDLIEKILDAKVKHEIACHSFSHIGFNKEYCSKELASAEIEKCSEVMSEFGIKPVSMVFPGNEEGYFNSLAKKNYKCVRYFPYEWVEISQPIKIKEGLWAIPESSNIVPDEQWDSRYVLWRLKKYVEKAMEKKALCHFWFHPSINIERINKVLFPLLKYCAKKRREGKLDILTMKDIGELMDKLDIDNRCNLKQNTIP